ncbi:amidohydrolase family protein [Streptomyces sp. bgisy091]|uniref:amidohydrolase family protein n=1 Tax=Streptomyces sp. bgisy091 TaxID=3413778 RepID=UPI003D75E0FE
MLRFPVTDASIAPAPDRSDDPSPGSGPYRRLVLRDVTVVDGTGAPPYGPVDLVIEKDTLVAVVSRAKAMVRMTDTPDVWRSLGAGSAEAADYRQVTSADRVMDLAGHYVLPGLVDAHAHLPSAAQAPGAQYSYKLWLGHGVTTVRELGSLRNGYGLTRNEARRSEDHTVVAPRIVPYVYFGHGAPGVPGTEREARDWVRAVADQGAAGVKFFGGDPAAIRAALYEARLLDIGSACHHAQFAVAGMHALDSARAGLRSVEHWYGLPEAMFADRRFQHFPPGYNELDEVDRFTQAGHLWQQSAPAGSARWEETLDALLDAGTALVPTFNVYDATRDAARVRAAAWHQEYTVPELAAYFAPDPSSHGSFFSDWGTEQEVAWRETYRIWMRYVRDYHDRGGTVLAGSDSGFLYKVFGFGLIEELELLREAGLQPLEVIHAATLAPARHLGVDGFTGSVAPGKRADLLVLEENPLANLKVLYGNGALRIGPDGVPHRAGGVRWTVRDGVVHDAGRLRADVRAMVREGRERRSAARSTDG